MLDISLKSSFESCGNLYIFQKAKLIKIKSNLTKVLKVYNILDSGMKNFGELC